VVHTLGVTTVKRPAALAACTPIAESSNAIDHAAVVAGVELAPGKARAAALFKKPSGDLEDAINGGRIAATSARGFVEMQGALPIIVDGEVIGAIGVSADTKEHDVQIARAGVAALKR
jgi:glc operon protein GlcG